MRNGLEVKPYEDFKMATSDSNRIIQLFSSKF